MIRLQGVTKGYRTKHGIHTVLSGISCTLPKSENIGILGGNGAGKSTLLRILAGIETPDSGTIERGGTVSWPIGFTGGFSGSLTGEENARFVARIYGKSVDEVVDFSREFADLGQYFFMPVRTYSSGMRARLAFGLSMAIDFDFYLVDEVTAVGDKSFQLRSRAAFQQRSERASVIIVSHNMKTIQDYCTRAAVLKAGRLELFDDLKTAQEAYEN
jgi:capsular polysaccharide transport system ATP-binding protein